MDYSELQNRATLFVKCINNIHDCIEEVILTRKKKADKFFT